ncbi:MAG: hypothetical protein HQL69_18530 [Magnetococcales bacterium]|nr:hypothetical protein [Magnetococcales bacterium]
MWNYEKFVKLYNAEAKRRGSGFFHYIPDDNTEFLKEWFEEDNAEENYSLKDFAIAQFNSEQVYADDLLPKFMDWQANND